MNLISRMGKVQGFQPNAAEVTPKIVFNTDSFGVFEYKGPKAQGDYSPYEEMVVRDEENLAEKMPKGFRSVFIQGETFFLAGGLDAKQ